MSMSGTTDREMHVNGKSNGNMEPDKHTRTAASRKLMMVQAHASVIHRPLSTCVVSCVQYATLSIGASRDYIISSSVLLTGLGYCLIVDPFFTNLTDFCL